MRTGRKRKLAGFFAVEISGVKCFGLEGTFRGHLAQHPCSEQGHLQLDQVAQSPSNLTLNVSRDGACTTSLGNPLHCFTTPTVQNFFLLSSLNLPSLSLKPLLLVLSQQAVLKRFSPSFLQAPFKYRKVE